MQKAKAIEGTAAIHVVRHPANRAVVAKRTIGADHAAVLEVSRVQAFAIRRAEKAVGAEVVEIVRIDIVNVEVVAVNGFSKDVEVRPNAVLVLLRHDQTQFGIDTAGTITGRYPKRAGQGDRR